MTQLNIEQDDLTSFDHLVEQTEKQDSSESSDVPQTFNWFGDTTDVVGAE